MAKVLFMETIKIDLRDYIAIVGMESGEPTGCGISGPNEAVAARSSFALRELLATPEGIILVATAWKGESEQRQKECRDKLIIALDIP